MGWAVDLRVVRLSSPFRRSPSFALVLTHPHPELRSRQETLGRRINSHASTCSFRGAFLGPALLAIISASALLPCSFAAESMLPGTSNVMMGAAAGTRYVRLNQFDFAALLPPPPAPGSVAALADLDTVLSVQAFRDEVQVRWARTIEKDDVFLHREILGDWFEPNQLPLTRALFRALSADLKAVDAAAKQPFQRQRPYEIDARVTPCVARPASTCYPSGTALQAMVWAEVLAQVFPAKRAELTARAHRAAWARVIGGVHFPSDLVAGRKLVEPFLAACRQSAAFERDFEAAREELLAAAPKSNGPGR